MSIELDVGADRADIRTTLIAWTEENRERIDALPEAEQVEIASKINAALEIIETDITPDLTEETVWAGFKEVPSAYLIHDAGALEARAALYVDEDKQALLHEFVTENVLDRYLVTGQVPAKFEAVLPAVADAYEEMHNHRLDAIPKEMKAYVQRASALGLDGSSVQERLINAVDDPVENARMERQDIARIVAHRGDSLGDGEAVKRAERDYRELQLALADVEQKVIDESTVIDPDGFRLAIQDAASTAYTTNRADFDSAAVGRDLLRAFVALEGREAMREIAQGSLDPLAEYIDTPAHRKLAAKELLKSAKSVDVGLELEEIETALEGLDPTYDRGKGIGL